MNTLVKWVTVAAMIGASGAATAQIETYDFTTSAGSGSFSYNCASLGSLCKTGGDDIKTGLLSSFTATINGISYSLANSNTGGLDIAKGGALESILFGDNCIAGLCAVTAGKNQWAIDTYPSYNGLYYSKPGSGIYVTSVRFMAAPEIDPASAASGLTLLAGGLAVLRGRRPRRLTALGASESGC